VRQKTTVTQLSPRIMMEFPVGQKGPTLRYVPSSPDLVLVAKDFEKGRILVRKNTR
jgi:hypothetical protein